MFTLISQKNVNWMRVCIRV